MNERPGILDTSATLVWLLRIGILGTCGVAIAALILAEMRYVASGSFIDHIEATMMILESNYLRGQPIYDLPDGIMGFSALYGPYAYLIHIGAAAVLGEPILAGKLASSCAVLATIAVLLWHFRQAAGPGVPAGVLAYVIAGLVFFHKSVIWIRAEPFITLLVALAVVTMGRRHAALMLGFCVGTAVNFKIHAAAFFLPLILESLLREGWRAWVKVAAVAAMFTLLPFALPGMDLFAYLGSVRQHVGGRSVWPDLGILAVWAALVLCFPILFVLAVEKVRRARVDSMFIWSALGTMVVLAYPASLQGAGVYHFLPFVPVLVAAYVRAQPGRPLSRVIPATVLVAALVNSVPVLWQFRPVPFGGEMVERIVAAANDPDLRPVQIGFGATAETYPIVQASRVALTLAGHPPVVDAQVLMELGVKGIDGSARWIPLLRQCAVKSWLVPAGEKPFRMIGYYAPAPVFGEGFRAAFDAQYRQVGTLGHFDLWQCRAG